MSVPASHNQRIKTSSFVEKLTPLFKIYIWGVLGRAADALFYFIVFKYAASEATGTFVWTMAIAAFFSVIMDFGLNQILGKEFGQERIGLTRAIGLTLATRLPIVLVSAISLFTWYYLWHPSTERVVAVSMALLVQSLIVFELTLQVWVKARGSFGTAGVLAILDPVARLFVALGLLVYGLPLVSSSLFGGFIVCHAVIISIHIWTATLQNRGSAETTKWLTFTDKKIIFAASGVTVISGLSIMQNRADWLILDTFVGPQILALYSLSNKIYELIMTVGGLGYSALFAQLSKSIGALENQKSQVLYQLRLVKISTIILAITSFMFCAIPLSFFEQFDELMTVRLTEVFSLMVIFSIMIAEMYYIALAAGAYRFVLITSIFTTIIQLFVNLYMIEKIGVWGAVVGMGVLAVCNVIIYLIFLKSFNVFMYRRTLIELFIVSGLVSISILIKYIYYIS